MNQFAVITRRFAPLLGMSLLLLAACEKNKFDPPAELTEFRSTVKVEHAWSAGVGGDKPAMRYGLGLALDGDRVFAAGHNGDVVAFDLRTGHKLWQTDTKLDLTVAPEPVVVWS